MDRENLLRCCSAPSFHKCSISGGSDLTGQALIFLEMKQKVRVKPEENRFTSESLRELNYKYLNSPVLKLELVPDATAELTP